MCSFCENIYFYKVYLIFSRKSTLFAMTDKVIQLSEILDFQFPRIPVGASWARDVLVLVRDVLVLVRDVLALVVLAMS